MPEIVWRGAVTGLSYNQYGRFVNSLNVGTTLHLRAVPNQYDEYAVGVFYQDQQIGWIPKAQNRQLRLMLDDEEELYTVITNHDVTKSFDTRLYVQVYDEPTMALSKAPKAPIRTKTSPSSFKETAMTKVDQIISSNKSAATSAAFNEAGRIVNKKAKEVLAKKAPLMVRGYVDTPVGGLVIANLAAMAVDHFRPNDQRLIRLTKAMQVQAYAELIQTFDIESFIDDLLDNSTVKRALTKLEEKEED